MGVFPERRPACPQPPAANRSSCRSALANQVRLVLHTAAYWLMLSVRDACPAPHPLAKAEFTTLRLRLLKVAARITEPQPACASHWRPHARTPSCPAPSSAVSSPQGRDEWGERPTQAHFHQPQRRSPKITECRDGETPSGQALPHAKWHGHPTLVNKTG